MKNNSNLPIKIRKSLAKEIQSLFNGKKYICPIEFNFKVKFPFRVAWLEDNTAQFSYTKEIIELPSVKKQLNSFYKKLDIVFHKKTMEHTDKIAKFNNKLDAICLKFKTDPVNEFELIVEDFKIETPKI